MLVFHPSLLFGWALGYLAPHSISILDIIGPFLLGKISCLSRHLICRSWTKDRRLFHAWAACVHWSIIPVRTRICLCSSIFLVIGSQFWGGRSMICRILVMINQNLRRLLMWSKKLAFAAKDFCLTRIQCEQSSPAMFHSLIVVSFHYQ